MKGAFFHGEFDEGTETVYMAVPDRFKNHYDNQVVLLLLKTISGLKSAAKAFWKELLKCFGAMKCKIIYADTCMYYKWYAAGMLVWLLWIDDCVRFVNKEAVEELRNEMMQLFDFDNVGNMDEYVA